MLRQQIEVRSSNPFGKRHLVISWFIYDQDNQFKWQIQKIIDEKALSSMDFWRLLCLYLRRMSQQFYEAGVFSDPETARAQQPMTPRNRPERPLNGGY